MNIFEENQIVACEGGNLGQTQECDAAESSRPLDLAYQVSKLRTRTAELAERNHKLQHSLDQLRTMQEEWLNSQKLAALARLSGGVAHDFNNLLTVILHHAAHINDNPTHAEVGADARTILDAAKRASEITRQLSAFSGAQEHHEELVEPNAIVSEVCESLRKFVPADVKLQLRLEIGVGRSRVDPDQLRQILQTLAVNAWDAMPHGGTLTFETRWADANDVRNISCDPARMLAVSVVDTGVGMDENTRQQLFEPFFTTKPVGQGKGLDLATLYGMVQRNRGRILVHTEVGKGSRFTVLLPADAVRPKSTERTQLRRGASTGRILVVDDEDAIRRIVTRILRARGFEIVSADSAAGALKIVGQNQEFDLVVTDVVMPNMGGPELVQRLRERISGIGVLFLSGHTFDWLDVGSLPQKHAKFLAKPFTSEELILRVEQILTAKMEALG